MMKKRLLIGIIGVFLILAAGAYALLMPVRYDSLDVVQLNDAIKTAEEYIDQDMFEALSEKEYSFSFAVLDEKENVLYQRDDAAITIFDAIATGGSVIKIQGGTFLLTSNVGNRIAHIRNVVFGCVILVLLLSALLCAAYVIYLDQKIIQPFSNMRDFAKNIAAGNFDVPLKMEKDNIFGAFTESFDLMRTELKLAKENERAAERSKKELVASLSHDIQTPLASIKALTELLNVQLSDEHQRQRLKMIEQKTEQIRLLTDNLFQATLEELRELDVKTTEQESKVLTKMLHHADYEGRLKKFRLPAAIIDCDMLRTQQVFDNIVGNSYKYAGTAIDVDAVVLDGFLQLTIRDSGGGVKESELPLISQKFYRGDNATGKSGSGLGLYMCEYFMKQMGGRMDIENLSGGVAVTLFFKLS